MGKHIRVAHHFAWHCVNNFLCENTYTKGYIKCPVVVAAEFYRVDSPWPE